MKDQEPWLNQYFYNCKSLNRAEVALGFKGVHEIKMFFKYTNNGVTQLQLKVLQLVKLLLSTERNLKLKKCFQPQQGQYKTIVTWKISPEEAIKNFNLLQITKTITGSLKSPRGIFSAYKNWFVNDDSLQFCNGTNKDVLSLITQRKNLSLVSSEFVPISWFPPLVVHMRRLLRDIWTKIGHEWNTKLSLVRQQSCWSGS